MSIDQLELATQALHQGETIQARKLVAQLLLVDPLNERAWVLMAQLVNNREQVIDCLNHVIKINPNNLAAQSALQAIRHQKHLQPVSPPVSSSTITSTRTADRLLGRPSAELLEAKQETRLVFLPEPSVESIPPVRKKVNTHLIIGSLIVLLVIGVAVFGPRLAPQDPMEEHFIMQLGDEWVRPPFSAFQVPGFILGSDQFGRDMFSRILYAVRPTLTLVSLVAVVRLILGTLIGLVAGWSAGKVEHILDILISAALTVPILLVALGAITILGAQAGLLAFIVGLSINGWGETARIVLDQTRLVRGQLFIESARSLGASSWHILTQHILRQVMPMVWMLFAFEMSSTMMVTAGLGFLGYYIGGDVWIEVSDFLAQRTSGAPELGQMLATSWSNLLQSWPLVVTGLAIFVIVLGFNLLGEGLRLRIDPIYINRNSRLALLERRFSMWFEESVSFPLSGWFKANRLRPAMVILVVVAIVASIYMYATKFAKQINPSQVALSVPGGQIWAAEKVDPYGTSYINSSGPTMPNMQWSFHNPSGFSGSPVISIDGMVYLASLDGMLSALKPDGTVLWQVALPETPLGPLALGPHGTIYVTDRTGGISAFDPGGTRQWTFTPDAAGNPNYGAIVDPEGMIYYLLENQLGDTLVALQPSGQVLWSIRPGTRAANVVVRLSPDGKQLYVKNLVVNAQDGSLADLTIPAQESSDAANQAQLFAGADGNIYLLAGQVVTRLLKTSQGYNSGQSADWNYRAEGFHSTSDLPLDAGVFPDGDVWLYYSGLFGGTSLYWLDASGKILGSFSSPLTQSNRLVAIDQKGTAYICGMGYSTLQGPSIMCNAYLKYASTPDWIYTFEFGIDSVVGAAIAPGRLYVITSDGTLTAIGDAEKPPANLITTP